MKFLRRVINNCVYSTAYSVLSECLWKNFTGDSGGIQTHDLLLTRADVLTSRPLSLPDDDWPARILYTCTSEFRDMYSWWNIIIWLFLKHDLISYCQTAIFQGMFCTKYNDMIILENWKSTLHIVNKPSV